MSISTSLVEGVIVLFAIILLAYLLKKAGVFSKSDDALFSRIVLQITLPAVIFSSLAVKQFDSDFLWMAATMAAIEIAIIILAWIIASLLQFEQSKKGALILVSAFGMTAMLGYPIIKQVFPNDALAMEEAVITSELGVGLLLFIIGPLIAENYGDAKVGGKSIFVSVRKFLSSPIFISLIAGIGFSFLPIEHDNRAFTVFIHFFKLIGNANLLMVAFTIGLILEFKRVQNIFLFITIAVTLKLGVKPMLAVWLTNNGGFTQLMREIVFIETALPSALLVAVFAKQYKCRPDLVSLAILIALFLSVFSVGLLFICFF